MGMAVISYIIDKVSLFKFNFLTNKEYICLMATISPCFHGLPITFFPSSDTLASSLEPLEALKFDACLLANLPFEILLDLLALSGLLSERNGLNFHYKATLENSEALTSNNEGLQRPLDADSNGTKDFIDPSTVRHTSVDSKNKEIFHRSDKLYKRSTSTVPSVSLQDNIATRRNSKPEMTIIVKPLLEVCALKSLTVLLSSNGLLETLTTEVYIQTSPSSEEHSQHKLNSLQTLLRSMVSYAVLPSPFKGVVSLRDLERVQSVLMRKPSSIYSNREVAVERKAASEGYM